MEQEELKEQKKVQAENMRLHKEIKRLQEEIELYKKFIGGV